MKLEFQRNRERYQFMKWGMQAFDTFGVVPPGFGIVHQVNLEYLARGVHKAADDGVCYFDSLVGTDSHTTMINGIGVVGWGVGGIEGEAAMLGQPVYFLTPDVVGFELTGKLREGCTATDLVLTSPSCCASTRWWASSSSSSAKARAAWPCRTAPPSATWRPSTARPWASSRSTSAPSTTSRAPAAARTRSMLEAYFKAQGMFGVPMPGEIDYSRSSAGPGHVTPSLSGPKRPQDRIDLGKVASTFRSLFSKPIDANGFNQPADVLMTRHLVTGPGVRVATTSTCARQSAGPIAAPRFVEMAGQQADRCALGQRDVRAASKGRHHHRQRRRADRRHHQLHQHLEPRRDAGGRPAGEEGGGEAGLTVKPHIKTSLAPGSRIVTEYLTDAGLLPYLEQLGFTLAGYGCMTCIGNSGDLTPEINEAISQSDLVCAAVLSGNRNFEARIHPNIKANFLASPPLVVAYAIAGTC
jgi:aconitate hydratase